MPEWHGYALLECSYALNGAQRSKFVQVLKALGNQLDNQPDRITVIRARPDGQALIVEAVLPDSITKNDFLDALAAQLGIGRALVDTYLTLTVSPGHNHEARAAITRAYLAAHSAEWES